MLIEILGSSIRWDPQKRANGVAMFEGSLFGTTRVNIIFLGERLRNLAPRLIRGLVFQKTMDSNSCNENLQNQSK